MPIHFCRSVAIFFVALLTVSGVAAQQSSQSASLRVYLDCQHSCDTQYLKQSLPIVDWVTEHTLADVHVMHAQQRTGSGGSSITLTFSGQRGYAAMSDTLSYATSGEATNDEERKALVHQLSIGLARYMARAGLANSFRIEAVLPETGPSTEASFETDPWNYWVFSLSGNSNINGQESTKSTRNSLSFSANRTTEALKVRTNGYLNRSKSEYDIGDQVITNEQNSESLRASVVRSIANQWAVGGSAFVSGSSYSNSRRIMELGPAVEYSVFPYSMSTSKFLTVQYALKLSHRLYDELTIFALDEEKVLRQTGKISLSLRQKWGSTSISGNVSHLLTNFDRRMTDSYSLGVSGFVDVRLYRGLSVNGWASYSRIRDQIDLPGDAATPEEILLQSKKLPTGYSYRMTFGLTYRFGSIFNNVVNPRLGGV